MLCLCDRDEVDQWNSLNNITYFLEKTNKSTWAGGLLDSWETMQRTAMTDEISQSYLQARFIGAHNGSLAWSCYTLIQLQCPGLRLMDSSYSRQFLIVFISILATSMQGCAVWCGPMILNRNIVLEENISIADGPYLFVHDYVPLSFGSWLHSYSSKTVIA